jgi:uncharacterized protein YigE (DUF2233 family)
VAPWPFAEGFDLRAARHLHWIFLPVACLALVAALEQEDVIETFKHVRAQTIDVGSYTVRLLEVNDPKSKFDGVTALWMQIPRDEVEISIEAISKQGAANEIYQMSSSGDELVVLSAGFHDANNEPVGLFVSHGKLISSLTNWTTGGILYQRQQTFGIIPVKQWNIAPTEVEYAVQARPLVVESGGNGILSDDGVVSDRVGIGFSKNGDLLVGGAFRKKNYRAFSLYDFGRLMAATSQDGGPGARTVLNLEGGPGAHIYFPGLQRHFGTSGSDFVMNSIHVRRARHK